MSFQDGQRQKQTQFRNTLTNGIHLLNPPVYPEQAGTDGALLWLAFVPDGGNRVKAVWLREKQGKVADIEILLMGSYRRKKILIDALRHA